MDVETVEAIEAVRHDIQAVRGEVRELRGEVQAVRDDLRGEMQTMHAEQRQYTKLHYESLHDDIRIVAEGLAMLIVKVDVLASGRGAS